MCKGTRSRVSSSLSLDIVDEKLDAIKNFKGIIVSLSGVHKDVYCAGKEETFKFLEDIVS